MNKPLINNFLSFWAQIAKENPTIDFEKEETKKMIYHHLIKIGVPEKENSFNVSQDLFKYWIDRYQNNSRIEAFVSANWNYFCQFQNGQPIECDNHIKIYLPADQKHIKEVANQIFDFLSNNNIEHHSKIAKEIRFDDIVVRLTSISDLHRLLSFINANKNIKNHLLPPNPFAFNYNNIAITSDGKLSYNSIISNYIRMFIAKLKSEKKLNEANMDNFVAFIRNYYIENFINNDNLKNVYNDFYFNDETSIHFMNLKHLTELFINASDSNFTLSDYIEHFQRITDPSVIVEEQRTIHRKLEKKENEETGKIETNTQIELLEVNKMLLETFKALVQKYGDRESAIERINSLIETKAYNYITRDNGLRFYLEKNNFANRLQTILKSYNTTLNFYLNMLLQKENENTINMQKVEEFMREFIITMSSKFSRERALINIGLYLNTGDVTNITRDNNLRYRIMASSFRDDLRAILLMYKISIEEYFNYIEKKYELNEKKKQ